MQHNTSESLELIDSLLTYYNIQHRDELSGPVAWGRIVSGSFPDPGRLIKSISEIGKSIGLNGGETLYKSDFLEKYRKRFRSAKPDIKTALRRK